MNKPLLLINDVQEKLTEISGHSIFYEFNNNKIEEVELSVSEFDLAVAKLKGQMRKMKEKLKRVCLSSYNNEQLEGEKQNYIQLAVDAKKTDLVNYNDWYDKQTTSKAYTKLAQ